MHCTAGGGGIKRFRISAKDDIEDFGIYSFKIENEFRVQGFC